MKGEFEGLVAVVTGAASGIGLAAARRLSDEGAQVAGLDLSASSIEAPIHGIRADVTDDASIRAAIDETVRRFGRIDILVNNAGIGARGNVEENDDEEWDAQMRHRSRSAC